MQKIRLTSQEKALFVNEELGKHSLFPQGQREVPGEQNAPWRISPEPYYLDEPTIARLKDLGRHLLAFYRGCQRLYRASTRGQAPSWVAEYLEGGKTELVIDYGRMNRFARDLPIIIRPDILLTKKGDLVISELDSVPGGFGLLGALSRIYHDLGAEIIGGRDGIVEGFRWAIEGLAPEGRLAIIVSRESSDYWEEMVWMGQALTDAGLPTAVIRPEEVEFRENGLYVHGQPLEIIYRFFELFDLKNIPKIDLILYGIRKGMVKVTPPLKSYLEEKLLFALFHHPLLKDFWWNTLGEETCTILEEVLPPTWIIDNRPLPPHGVIPGLTIGERAINSWQELKDCTQRQRELVLKPSGFSELAWGSRGVHIGHDLSSEKWAAAVDEALESFPQTPYVLQPFVTGRRDALTYYDFAAGTIKDMAGRTRLCPYYFVRDEEVVLGGILATSCPLNKKAIHGMVEAIMTPTA
ncbi:MAG: hypothetical protein ACOYD6_03660, partial [Limnochordia bacterium]